MFKRNEGIKIAKIRVPEEYSTYFEIGDCQVHVVDWYVVERPYGGDVGEALWKLTIPRSSIRGRALKVLREATDEDLIMAHENRVSEKRAFKICLQKIKEHNQPMKLSRVKYTFDGDKILFFFTAEGRVDFRELVRDLARTVRKRIELIQIGVRDEAKLLGGCGVCGRPLCCSLFMDQFKAVNIKMAKNQDLSLIPSKISGLCGRLFCCLRFEDNWYCEVKRSLPRQGEVVKTPYGVGEVLEVDIFRETLKIRLEDETEVKIEASEAIRGKWRYNPRRLEDE
ncbi:MAG: stage 0 sporulation protein [Candidatus Thorarchaeota archaeon]|nr:MAG: stage 0 sporulation protein [Candidatus Thorarchaeota archaeon]